MTTKQVEMEVEVGSSLSGSNRFEDSNGQPAGAEMRRELAEKFKSMTDGCLCACFSKTGFMERECENDAFVSHSGCGGKTFDKIGETDIARRLFRKLADKCKKGDKGKLMMCFMTKEMCQ